MQLPKEIGRRWPLALPTARLVAGRDACTIALTSTDETRSVSKNDLLAAYVWSCITSARLQIGGHDENLQSSCHNPCDIGKRINPELPNAFFGSAKPRLVTSMNFKRPSHVAKKLQESDDLSPLDYDYPFRSQSSFGDRQRRRSASSPACSECRVCQLVQLKPTTPN